MPRPRGFDAGRLMEGETTRSTEQPTEVLKDAPLRSELDPTLLEKLVSLPQVVVGSVNPEMTKKELRDVLKRLENNKRIEMTEWSYELLDSDAFIIGPAENRRLSPSLCSRFGTFARSHTEGNPYACTGARACTCTT